MRKHLSAIKGGRLAARARPAKVVTLAISDVPGDDPAVIGSGPTVPDPTTLADARAVIARYRLDLPDAIARALNDRRQRIAQAGRSGLCKHRRLRSSRVPPMPSAAAAKVNAAGYECILLGDRLEGEARAVAADHAALARDLARTAPARRDPLRRRTHGHHRGQGRGGPNQEYALALAPQFDGIGGIAALAADTDGTDGGAGSADDPAGAYVDGRYRRPAPARPASIPPLSCETTIPPLFCRRCRTWS